MPAAARKTDKVLHNSPHCHAPIHPAAPVPTPQPHPPKPYQLQTAFAQTVMINGLNAATAMTMTEMCQQPTCVPGAPGMVAMGSSKVMICMLPAARAGDMVTWPSCVAPIPSPTGKIIPPCSTNVIIGG